MGKVDGHCNRCGDCCRGDPFDPESGRAYCPFFSFDANGFGVCSGRDSRYYFENCALFPQTQAQIALLPNCSYRKT